MLWGGACPWRLSECDNARFKKPACVVVPLLANGVIADIEGLQEIQKLKSCVDILQLADIGDSISAQGTLNQALARIYMVANSERELVDTIAFVKNTLYVRDERGHNMLLPWFADSEIKKYFRID